MKYNQEFFNAMCKHGEAFPETGAWDFFCAYQAGGEL